MSLQDRAPQDEIARAFHALHVPGEPLVLFNAWDAGSARAVVPPHSSAQSSVSTGRTRFDGAIGAVAGRVPSDALLLVHLSHGMGPHYDATHMLDEILTRLDSLEDGGQASSILADRAKRAVWPFVAPLGRLARAIVVPAAVRARSSWRSSISCRRRTARA